MKNGIALITPISKDLLYVKIADAIQNYIRMNKLQPGDKLPSERTLSVQFQTGRYSVREALRVLEAEKIIEVKTGSGAYIAENSTSSSIFLKLVKVNYLELLSIKTSLEKLALQSVIENGKQSQFDQLEIIVTKLEKEGAQGIYDVAADKKFHKMLVEISGNKTLAQMIVKIIEAFDDYSGVLDQSATMCIETIPCHRQMLDAIKERNVELANKACDRIMSLDTQVLHAMEVYHSNGVE